MGLYSICRNSRIASKVREAAQGLSGALKIKRGTQLAGGVQTPETSKPAKGQRSHRKPVLEGPFKKYKGWIFGALWFVLAILFGIWANDASEASAILAWEKKFRPSLRIAHHAFASRAYAFQTDPKKVQSAEYTLPSTIDQEGSFWVSNDHNWVAYFAKAEDMIRPYLYCYDCTQKPKEWTEQGLGWRALDTILETLDVLAAKRPKAKAVKKGQAEYRDPREIRF